MSAGQDATRAEARREELAERLDVVRERLAAACAAAGRAVDDVTLVAVTKFFGAADVRTLAALGVTEVGENRHQEAEEKAAELAEESLRWHFVGGLQSNKAAAVARWADVVESVDRRKLVARLDGGAAERGRDLDCLVQVSLDDPGSSGTRAGCAPSDLPALADAVAEAPHLRLRGLMAVAPTDEDPAAAFDRLAELHARLRGDHPDATWLSAGMSNDLEQAVERGATHVRVGRAVLGERPSNQ
ncbi:YggS family pyridoxal phosphate-dependent enzyme [Nocardioides sp. CFH 31398]|uniref:YggS family pyridoxal phosphate-dependent enzyme n=1 Tax=Nocardioides sp. CFH 31398 TaxID=2919579 RepID=UPI001F063A84|nr:YggS family pyridoxal phosphate-dependent enzyme [Nocardioides sp. CFH 31398]MCH1868284.1 YggS family pyridoxal phosphate-dependent enzyme [Nocardioides sp. CFH 31398]